MRIASPTVKPLIEALQLADLLSVDSLDWSVLAAWVHPGPRTSDYLTGRRAPPRHPALSGVCAAGATLLLA